MADFTIKGTIFLSHASSDKTFVERVYRRLDPAMTFYDIRTISAGQATLEAMRAGISSTAVYVLFHSIESQTAWVEFEKSLAEIHLIINPSTKILVCPINGSDYRSLPPWMARYMTTTKDFKPNDIARSIQYLYKKSIEEAYPETVKNFPGREILQRKISLSLMRESASTGRVTNALVLTGLQGMGRGTLADAIVNEAYKGMRPAGPIFEMPAYGDAIDWHLKFLADFNEGLSEAERKAQIEAFDKLPPLEQAKTLLASLRHWSNINQVVTIRHRWGLRDKGNNLRPWLFELLQEVSADPNIRLILISERRFPLEAVADLGNLQQFALEELDSESIQFILSERIEPRYLDPQRLPKLSDKINGHPATANYTAYLINGGRSIESLIISYQNIYAFQDKVLSEIFDSGILSDMQKQILKLLSIFPQLSSLSFVEIFKEKDSKSILNELWELVEFSLVSQSDGGRYKSPAVVSGTYRRRSIENEKELLDRASKFLSEHLDKGDFDFDLIDSLLVAVVDSGEEISDRLMSFLTPASIEPVIEKEYYDGLGGVGEDARVHFGRCFSLAKLAMHMNVADDLLENMLFYGADASVRLGILPDDMLAFMRKKAFLAADYVQASFLFYVERKLPQAAAILSKNITLPSFKIRNVRLLTRIYIRDGQFTKALAALDTISPARLMRDTGLVVMKVKALRGTRNHRDAGTLLTELSGRSDDYGDYAIYMASADLRNARYPSALGWIEKAKHAPRVNRAALSFLQCICEVEQGDNSSLANTCALARATKRDADALQLLARSALFSGDWRAAESYISQISSKDWFDLNVEYRVLDLKMSDSEVKRDPVAFAEAQERSQELLRQSVSAVEGSNYA